MKKSPTFKSVDILLFTAQYPVPIWDQDCSTMINVSLNTGDVITMIDAPKENIQVFRDKYASIMMDGCFFDIHKAYLNTDHFSRLD
jgi:hypothetical protein